MGSESAGPTSANEDGEARYHLDRLRDGTQREKIAARMSLARIFERRGMLDEVVELY